MSASIIWISDQKDGVRLQQHVHLHLPIGGILASVGGTTCRCPTALGYEKDANAPMSIAIRSAALNSTKAIFSQPERRARIKEAGRFGGYIGSSSSHQS